MKFLETLSTILFGYDDPNSDTTPIKEKHEVAAPEMDSIIKAIATGLGTKSGDGVFVFENGKVRIVYEPEPEDHKVFLKMSGERSLVYSSKDSFYRPGSKWENYLKTTLYPFARDSLQDHNNDPIDDSALFD